jgi:glycosyltransferase involved in cell wall biosynthesis
MHIALINTHFAPDLVGGAERSLQVLAHSLRDRGHRVSVVCLATTTQPGSAAVDGVQVVYLPTPELRWRLAPDQRYPWRGLPGWLKPFWHLRETCNRQQYQRIVATLEQLQPDLVHTNNLLGLSAGCWGAVKSLGLPLLHTLRDYQLLCPRGQMMKGDMRCDRQCTACRAYSLSRNGPSRLVDAVIGNSKFILDRHLAAGFFSQARTCLPIYNAWDEGQEPQPRSQAGASSALRLGFMGNLTAVKGLHRMLASLRSLLENNQVKVLVAGNGDAAYLEHLRQQFPANVEFLGWKPSPELLAGIDLLVIPSLYEEPLSRTIFEAYRCGVPVLASRRGGHPEVIEQGVSGFCYEPEQPGALTSIVQRLIAEPTMLLGLAQGAKAAAPRFAPQRLADEHLALYSQLLEPLNSDSAGSSSGAGASSKSS